ncbi:MAG TPA: alpha/beta fold hydrolase [Aliidongia sp.]|uniref:alpha/beta hydrolase n=1 Tax=Aliidongia sp. TaxID=1914230 RepID=UPI002DDD8D2E|nr:alpha/beta fold hydrolase [Aliidongia sp.]HEV2676995.1 alpha/beta fold hydrolase [Aliidongia sp.]
MRLPLLCFALLLAATSARAEAIKLQAADGVAVFAEVWRAPDRPNGAKPPVIIAFHQAEANHAEFAPIAPRLVAAGFTVLAIDQRAGGGMFGAPNRTVTTLGKQANFRAALPDLEAALIWGHQAAAGAPVVAIGSSYSAALVFLLAARHPGALAAILAFSPGEYLDGPQVVHQAAQQVQIPVLVDSAKSPDEIAAAKSLLDAVPAAGKVQIVPHSGGVHGASTLRTDKDPAGAEENWRGVLAFLAPFAAP